MTMLLAFEIFGCARDHGKKFLKLCQTSFSGIVPCVGFTRARYHPGTLHSLWKTVGKALPILVTLTSRSDSDVESSNVSLIESIPDGVNPNSYDIDYYVQKNEGKILWFSADGNAPNCSKLDHVHK